MGCCLPKNQADEGELSKLNSFTRHKKDKPKKVDDNNNKNAIMQLKRGGADGSDSSNSNELTAEPSKATIKDDCSSKRTSTSSVSKMASIRTSLKSSASSLSSRIKSAFKKKSSTKTEPKTSSTTKSKTRMKEVKTPDKDSSKLIKPKKVSIANLVADSVREKKNKIPPQPLQNNNPPTTFIGTGTDVRADTDNTNNDVGFDTDDERVIKSASLDSDTVVSRTELVQTDSLSLKDVSESGSEKEEKRDRKEPSTIDQKKSRMKSFVINPESDIVFHAPFDRMQTHEITLHNRGSKTIGWICKSNQMGKFEVEKGCGALQPGETVPISLKCRPFDENELNALRLDRVIFLWIEAPTDAIKPAAGEEQVRFDMSWFQKDGLIRRKNLFVLYKKQAKPVETG